MGKFVGTLFSDPVEVGTLDVNDEGVAIVDFVVPDVPAGGHHLELRGNDGSVYRMPILVTDTQVTDGPGGMSSTGRRCTFPAAPGREASAALAASSEADEPPSYQRSLSRCREGTGTTIVLLWHIPSRNALVKDSDARAISSLNPSPAQRGACEAVAGDGRPASRRATSRSTGAHRKHNCETNYGTRSPRFRGRVRCVRGTREVRRVMRSVCGRCLF
ncbi:hypothetical protein G418_25558 [Rhodococcus qingshengii BKS 20-40]|nr:hypothetical protein G418_25558 [Rhodococcus qingshengii BKS 20-40]